MPECLNDTQRRVAEENVGLVYAALKKFRVPGCGEDLFGAGCVGLCKAALRWREGGAPFSTFAYHLIECEMINELRARRQDRELCARKAGFIQRPSASIEAVDTALTLARLVQNLPALLEERELRILRLLLRGWKAKEIAVALAVSESSVRRARARAAVALGRWINGG